MRKANCTYIVKVERGWVRKGSVNNSIKYTANDNFDKEFNRKIEALDFIDKNDLDNPRIIDHNYFDHNYKLTVDGKLL